MGKISRWFEQQTESLKGSKQKKLTEVMEAARNDALGKLEDLSAVGKMSDWLEQQTDLLRSLNYSPEECFRQHDLFCLAWALSDNADFGFGEDEAIALACELRDRYQSAMTVQHLTDAVRAGRLIRVPRGYVVLPMPDLRYYSGGDCEEDSRPRVIGDNPNGIPSDRTCSFNAQSPHLRCAVNPVADSCDGCKFYEPRQFVRNSY